MLKKIFFSVYEPNAEEIEDPKLFAKNVRAVMAKALKVPTNDMTFEQVKQTYGKHYKRKSKDD